MYDRQTHRLVELPYMAFLDRESRHRGQPLIRLIPGHLPNLPQRVEHRMQYDARRLRPLVPRVSHRFAVRMR